jgi:hypothetical protein
MRQRQVGITFIGWLFLLVPLAIVGYAGLRVTPLYLNYFKVADALTDLAAESQGDDGLTAAALRTSLTRRFEIDSIVFPTAETVRFTREGKSWVAQAAYEDEVPLFADLSLLVKFDKRVVLN